MIAFYFSLTPFTPIHKIGAQLKSHIQSLFMGINVKISILGPRCFEHDAML
jgi:hypothetical protein